MLKKLENIGSWKLWTIPLWRRCFHYGKCRVSLSSYACLLLLKTIACSGPESNDKVFASERRSEERSSSPANLGAVPSSTGDGPASTSTQGTTVSETTASESDTSAEDGAQNQPKMGTPENPAVAKGVVRSGDSLGKILQRVGMNAQEIYRLSQALLPLTDPSQLKLGQAYEIKPGPDSKAAYFHIRLSPVLAIDARINADGQWSATKDEAKTQVRQTTISTTIQSSLYQSILDAGEHSSLVNKIADVFAYDINFFVDPRRGDHMRAVVERVELSDGTLLHYRDILVAEYDGEVGTYRIYRWQAPKKDTAIYVNDDGKGVAKTLLKTPLAYTRVSSEFSPRRMHPVLHRVKGHHGVDYAAPVGTPIRAAADGVIRFRGPKGGAGNFIVLSHDGGMKTLYMHLSKFAPGQRVGQRVTQKTVIGYVGMTGLATGPHLHFGVKIGGRYVDPLKVDGQRGVGVRRRHRKKFRALRDRWRAKLDAIAQNPS